MLFSLDFFPLPISYNQRESGYEITCGEVEETKNGLKDSGIVCYVVTGELDIFSLYCIMSTGRVIPTCSLPIP